MRVFEPARIGTVELKNRVLRSATFEGLSAREGSPGPEYLQFYDLLSGQGLGAIITGFCYVSQDGRAMQPGQAGLESEAKIPAFRRVTGAVHANGTPIFLQLAHAGRQTTSTATGGRVYAPSAGRSPYFRSEAAALTQSQISYVANCFAQAARRAREADFDGVQLHAAHGYLLHQFLNPVINRRTDVYGLKEDVGIGTAFLEEVIEACRAAVGNDYPLLIKVSAGDNYGKRGQEERFIQLIRFLDRMRVAAIETSFGTMDHALNIFRGSSIPVNDILDFNPRYGTRNALKRYAWKKFALPIMKRQFEPFAPTYNLGFARLARRHTRLPIISVGGFRSGPEIREAIEEDGIDFVSLCRPLLCEPDFVLKVQADASYRSRCRNCNRCAVMCDSGFPTCCYLRRTVVPSQKQELAL